MAVVKLSTGLKTYEIKDENGTIRGSISFNPCDYGLVTRARDTVNKINELIAQIDGIKETATSEDELIDVIKRFDAEIKNQINILFDDNNTSDVIFGNQLVFNTLNGETFVERFLKAFIPIIEKDVKAEMKKSEKKIEKYTKQVR